MRERFPEEMGKRGHELRQAWMARFESYGKVFPKLADELYRMQHRQLPDDWDEGLPTFSPDPKGLATRDSSGKVLNVLARNVPWLMGGAADLAPSTKTRLTADGFGDFEVENRRGRNMHFGIREHAMGAILNGISLSKIRPFGSTFLIFSDYCKPAIRLSAIMELPTIYILRTIRSGLAKTAHTSACRAVGFFARGAGLNYFFVPRTLTKCSKPGSSS